MLLPRYGSYAATLDGPSCVARGVSQPDASVMARPRRHAGGQLTASTQPLRARGRHAKAVCSAPAAPRGLEHARCRWRFHATRALTAVDTVLTVLILNYTWAHSGVWSIAKCVGNVQPKHGVSTANCVAGASFRGRHLRAYSFLLRRSFWNI